MALLWVLRNPVVTSALIGASRPEQIEKNVRAFDNPTLSEEELRMIEDIDWEKKSIHLQRAVRFRNNRPEISTKMKTSSANRTVPLWDSLIPYLGTPQKSGLIVHCERQPLSERQFSNRWRAIQKSLKNAGLKEPFTPHQLRHTYATVAANSGDVPIKVLQGLMGHANFQTTMNTYASLDTDQILTTRSIISDKYARISEKSCSKNCSA